MCEVIDVLVQLTVVPLLKLDEQLRLMSFGLAMHDDGNDGGSA